MVTLTSHSISTLETPHNTSYWHHLATNRHFLRPFLRFVEGPFKVGTEAPNNQLLGASPIIILGWHPITNNWVNPINIVNQNPTCAEFFHCAFIGGCECGGLHLWMSRVTVNIAVLFLKFNFGDQSEDWLVFASCRDVHKNYFGWDRESINYIIQRPLRLWCFKKLIPKLLMRHFFGLRLSIGSKLLSRRILLLLGVWKTPFGAVWLNTAALAGCACVCGGGRITACWDRPPKRGELKVLFHVKGASKRPFQAGNPVSHWFFQKHLSVSCLYLSHTGMARFLFFEGT